MKKQINNILIACVALLVMLSLSKRVEGQGGVWTWMSGSNHGSNISTDTVIWGTQGVPSVNNRQAQLYAPISWTDLQGNFWLFGGMTLSFAANDNLWKFNPATLTWTWVKGSGTLNNIAPVYGTQGIPSINNTPGSRAWSECNWVDSNGDLWFYGGGTTTNIAGCDLWRYRIATNEWTWMSGSNIINSAPVYGTLGVASATNFPGSRREIGGSWVDNNGKFWIYAGADGSGNNFHSDMWMYDPSTTMWTWESGSQAFSVPASYGTQGVFSSTNTPGARLPFSMWKDNSGHLWFFGGLTPFGGCKADLWEYDISINQWAWMGGSQILADSTTADLPCVASPNYFPDSRYETRATWEDSLGNFWLFGGSRLFPSKLFGDMWVYLINCHEWERVSSSSFINAYAAYGVLGVPSATNHPGCRAGSGHWKDNSGNFWIFGGSNNGINNDVWRFVPDYSCLDPSCSGGADFSLPNDKLFSVSPNPATNTIAISGAATANTQNCKITITDLTGKVLKTFTTYPAVGIPVSDLYPGVYIISLQTKEGREVGKFIKE